MWVYFSFKCFPRASCEPGGRNVEQITLLIKHMDTMRASSFSVYYSSNICTKVGHGPQPLSSETSVQSNANVRSVISI